MTARQRRGQERSAGSSGSTDGGKNKKTDSGPFSGRFNPTFGRPENTADSTALPHQTWARLVMVAGVLAVVYFSGSTNPSSRTFMAKRDEFIKDKRYQNLLCAPSYKREIKELGNERCLPVKCGRVVWDNVVQTDEAADLLKVAKKGFSKGGSAGGASILDLHSGAMSQGTKFIDVYKVHPHLFTEEDFDLYRRVKDKVKQAVASHFGLDPASLYLAHPTFFSRLTSVQAQTAHDEYWHVHVDKETYENFHYTSLLYLTDGGGVDFKGGEFVFVDGNDRMNRTIEPRLGRVSAFTSGVENKHHVEKVTEGTRFALTFGFTCDKSKEIPDPGRRLRSGEKGAP